MPTITSNVDRVNKDMAISVILRFTTFSPVLHVVRT
jgi:hypothetical protein